MKEKNMENYNTDYKIMYTTNNYVDTGSYYECASCRTKIPWGWSHICGEHSGRIIAPDLERHPYGYGRCSLCEEYTPWGEVHKCGGKTESNPEYQTGWVCPTCGSVYSPYVLKCGVCPKATTSNATTAD